MASSEKRVSYYPMIFAAAALVSDGILSSSSNEFLISYAHDVLLPVQAYFGLRATWLDRINNSKFNTLANSSAALFIFGVASYFEMLQKAGVYPGTYDFPGDFIAYGVGAGLAITLDALAFRKLKN